VLLSDTNKISIFSDDNYLRWELGKMKVKYWLALYNVGVWDFQCNLGKDCCSEENALSNIHLTQFETFKIVLILLNLWLNFKFLSCHWEMFEEIINRKPFSKDLSGWIEHGFE
jgi:hypothetical protein